MYEWFCCQRDPEGENPNLIHQDVTCLEYVVYSFQTFTVKANHEFMKNYNTISITAFRIEKNLMKTTSFSKGQICQYLDISLSIMILRLRQVLLL